jgi:hypothetical protein
MPEKKADYVVVGHRKVRDVDNKARVKGDPIVPNPDYADMLVKAGHIAVAESDEAKAAAAAGKDA